MPITDPDGIIYVHLAGRPLSESYDAVVDGANKAMEEAASDLKFRKDQQQSRRGFFPTINVGMSSGSGNAVSFQNSRIQNLIKPPETSHVAGAQTSSSPHAKVVRGPQHDSDIGVC